MTPRNFLVRGLLAGFVAGIFAFTFGHFVGEIQIDAAIAVEEANAEPAPPADESVDEGHHSTEVSRQAQSTWGLATGLLAVGTATGGVVGLASAFAVGRLGRLRPAQSTALVALLGFVAYALVPFVKYPATPPAVGDEATIGDRTLYFFALQGTSLLAMVCVVLAARRLLDSQGVYRSVVGAGVVYLLVVAVVGALLPTVNEIGDFPADVLWYFRRDSLATLVIVWTVIGVVLSGLVGRLHAKETARIARRDLAASL